MFLMFTEFLPQPIPAEEHQVDLVISDAQYLPLRKADQPGPDPALDPWWDLCHAWWDPVAFPGKSMKILSKIARKHLIKMLNIHEHPPFLDYFPGVLSWVFHKRLA